MSQDIFISHAREDSERIAPLVRAVEALGYSVFPVEFGIAPGDRIDGAIERAVSAAGCVIVVWSQAAAASEWVRVEIQRMQGYEKKLLLVFVEHGVPPVSELANIQGFDLTDWDNRPKHPAFQTLSRRIAELAGPPPENSSLEQTETPPRRTRRLRVPDIAWVEIPGGPFVYQEGETRELPTFRIARYPVTNAQYQTFIDDDGYGDDRWWTDLKRPEPEAPRWPQANRPRTNVDWYEAVAFTRWLNARLGIREGSIRLPTELEWEKAARGERGLEYPWGEGYRAGYANLDETLGEQGPWYLEQTTAVGLYPQGRSPYGVEDLAGTVWEWCLNKYEDLAATALDTSGASRALRGGSWAYDPDNARADYRSGNLPDNRYDLRGFRLFSSVPIEPVRR